MWEEKDKLTQYDLDRANKRLDILKAQIALEEAQQDQSQMRLVRGADGTYGYEYIADQNKILQAEEDLAAAQNDLYNLDVNEYRSQLNEMYESYVEYYEKMKELAADEEGLTEDDLKLLQQMEEDLLLAAQFTKDIESNLSQSLSTIVGSTITPENLKDYISLAGTGMAQFATELLTNGLATVDGALPDLIAGEQSQWSQTREKITGEVQGIVDQINLILLGNEDPETKGLYDTLLEDATDYVSTFNTDVRDKIIDSWNEMKQAALDYAKAVSFKGKNVLAESVIEEYGAGNIFDKNYNIKNIDEAKVLLDDEIVVSGHYQDGLLLAQRLDQISGGSEYIDYAKQLIAYENKDLQSWFKNINSQPDMLDGHGNNPFTFNEIVGVNSSGKLYIKDDAGIDSSLGYLDDLAEILKNINTIMSFDTGGYTGEWGANGRIAMLHEKELVLNKEDTQNILLAVDSVRAIKEALNGDMISALLDRLAVSSHKLAEDEMNKEMLIEQQVHIEAIFPDLNVAAEVEEALTDLIDSAAQELTKNTRK